MEMKAYPAGSLEQRPAFPTSCAPELQLLLCIWCHGGIKHRFSSPNLGRVEARNAKRMETSYPRSETGGAFRSLREHLLAS